jgi:hypothetical protein
VRLLEPAALGGLLQLLSDKDMPVDLLQLLVYMSEDGCRSVFMCSCAHACSCVAHGRWARRIVLGEYWAVCVCGCVCGRGGADAASAGLCAGGS